MKFTISKARKAFAITVWWNVTGSNLNVTQARLKAKKDSLSVSLKEIFLYIGLYKEILLSKYFSQ